MTVNDDTLEVTILLPCLNEANTVAFCIDEASRFLQRSGLRGEVVIADNGSDDGSQRIARAHGARVVDIAFRGYGAAIHYGCLEAKGRYIVIADADGSYDLENLDAFLGELRAGADLVVGDRFRGGISPGAMPWKNRYIGNPVLSCIGRLLCGPQIRDFHCGLRAIRRDALFKLELISRGMEYASEMIIKAGVCGLRVAEVPTTLRPDGRARPPHLRPWRDGWRHLRLIMMFAHRPVLLYPGLMLMVLGGALMIALRGGPIHVFGVILDIHTMLYAAFAVMIGVQCLMFGAFVHVYSSTTGFKAMSPRLERLVKPISLELGVLVGMTLMGLGVAGTLASMAAWGAEGFRHMNPQQGFRTVIPSATLLFVGLQVLIASFFMSVLKLGLRRIPSSHQPR
jgi:glycosyltransferase involved in cell wall biosynthesis